MVITGRLIFHEKMKVYHYIGILMLMGCSIIISFSGGKSKTESIEVRGNVV